uniref:Uncharacterized protein n=1 Tax=Cyclopterus lumpus TaxID=8103 RepID=A0A8C2XIM3_CYCLU
WSIHQSRAEGHVRVTPMVTSSHQPSIVDLILLLYCVGVLNSGVRHQAFNTVHYRNSRSVLQTYFTLPFHCAAAAQCEAIFEQALTHFWPLSLIKIQTKAQLKYIYLPMPYKEIAVPMSPQLGLVACIVLNVMFDKNKMISFSESLTGQIFPLIKYYVIHTMI